MGIANHHYPKSPKPFKPLSFILSLSLSLDLHSSFVSQHPLFDVSFGNFLSHQLCSSPQNKSKSGQCFFSSTFMEGKIKWKPIKPTSTFPNYSAFYWVFLGFFLPKEWYHIFYIVIHFPTLLTQLALKSHHQYMHSYLVLCLSKLRNATFGLLR